MTADVLHEAADCLSPSSTGRPRDASPSTSFRCRLRLRDLCSCHDRGRGHADTGDARAAEAIERDAARPHVIACVQCRHPADVAGLLTNLSAGTPNNVVDLGGVDAGAFSEGAQNGRTELLWVDVRERTSFWDGDGVGLGTACVSISLGVVSLADGFTAAAGAKISDSRFASSRHFLSSPLRLIAMCQRL